MALPSGYTPLEYIDSTGSQYVDTGFKHNNNTRVVMKAQVTTKPSSHAWLFEGRTQNATHKSVFLLNGTVWNTDYVNASEGRYAFSSVGVTDLLNIDYNKNVVNINGYTHTYTAETFQSDYNLVLFAANTAGTVAGYISARIWETQIYDNGTLIRDLLPCTNPSGEVGLYDDVNGVFYGDAAGVGFVAGPVAAQPEAPAYLEVIGTTRNAAVLAWPGAPGCQSYRLYRDGVVVYEGSNLCYTDAGLAAWSAHVYSVHTVIGSTESEGVTTEATTSEGIVLITDRTAGDVSAGRRKGFYNALDLIRVGEAMAYLEERFAAVGVSVTVSPKLDWQLSDIPTHAQALHYLTDIGVLRGKLTEFRETVSLPDALTALTWAQANDIEIILLDVEKLIRDIILSYRHYSGRTISGVNALP